MATTMLITSDGETFVFDAVLSAEHKSSVSVTSHPVQYGASIVDHAINEPDEVMLSVGMTDTMEGVDSNHSVNAFAKLKQITESRKVVSLVTRLGRYENMLITSLSAPDDYTTMYGLKANIIFTHIEIVPVSVVTVQQTVSSSKTSGSSSGATQTKDKKKSSKDKGKKSTSKNQSVLSKGAKTELGKKLVGKIKNVFNSIRPKK